MLPGRDEEQALAAIIEAIYQAALEGSRWPEALERVRDHLDAQSCLLRLFDERRTRVQLTLTVGFDPAFDRFYREHLVGNDPLREHLAALPCGRIASTDREFPFARLKRTALYADYMRPQDKRFAMGCVLLREAGAFAMFGVQRGHRRFGFQESDVARLAGIVPHLQQALRIRGHIGALEMRCASLSAFIDRIPVPVLFLDANGTLVVANGHAETLLGEGAGLAVRNGRPHLRNPVADRALQRAVAQALRPVADASAPSHPQAIAVAPARQGEGALSVLVLPWHTPYPKDFGEASRIRVAVLLGPAERSRGWRCDLVAAALGLTRTEARLVIALVAQGELRAAAGTIGVQEQTARGYLKNIFRKTGCRRQCELLNLFYRSPVGALDLAGGVRV